MPKENAKDIPELPEKVRTELELIPVDHMDQVLKIALRPVPIAPAVVPRRSTGAPAAPGAASPPSAAGA